MGWSRSRSCSPRAWTATRWRIAASQGDGRGARQQGIRVHRCRYIDASTHYEIRVTTPARTLVDLADVPSPKHLARALNEAQVQRLVTPVELATLLTRHPGRRTSQLTLDQAAAAAGRLGGAAGADRV